MTAREMHIALDLATQMMNSSRLLKLQNEAKDLYLNRAVTKYIKDIVFSQIDNSYNITTYQDIRAFYNKVAPLIYELDIPIHDIGYKYSSFLLPTTTRALISTGGLEAGIEYRVVTAGTTNLEVYGGTNPPVKGATFVCTLPPLISGTTIYRYCTYQIKGNAVAPITDFTALGASDNYNDTIFVATTSGSFVSANGAYALMLESVGMGPTWADGTQLERVFTYDYDYPLSIKANVDSSSAIITGELTEGKKYRVLEEGATNLLEYGHTSTPILDTVFLCTKTGTPTWDGVTHLAVTEDYECRLMKTQDTQSSLNHAYGTTYDCPIADFHTINDGTTIRVYNDGTFRINQISLVYSKKPDSITLDLSKNSNLFENIHDEIVTIAAMLIKEDDARYSGATTKQ
jgi:hypothetical protein